MEYKDFYSKPKARISKVAKKILDRKKKNKQKLKVMEKKMKSYVDNENNTRNIAKINPDKNHSKSESAINKDVPHRSKPAGKAYSQSKYNKIKPPTPNYNSSV